MSEGAHRNNRRGLSGALGGLGAALVGLVRTRLELVAIEVDEARIRATEQLVLIIVAGVAFAFALLALSALVVVVYWDTNRIAALFGVVIAYIVVGSIALWRLSVKRKTRSKPFAESLAQLGRDRAWIANELGDQK